MELLGTDSCRETVPMELSVPNSSMQHPDPDLDFDDTRMVLQGASCTIAAGCGICASLDTDIDEILELTTTRSGHLRPRFMLRSPHDRGYLRLHA